MQYTHLACSSLLPLAADDDDAGAAASDLLTSLLVNHYVGNDSQSKDIGHSAEFV